LFFTVTCITFAKAQRFTNKDKAFTLEAKGFIQILARKNPKPVPGYNAMRILIL
jgi:hypothetical protein